MQTHPHTTHVHRQHRYVHIHTYKHTWHAHTDIYTPNLFSENGTHVCLSKIIYVCMRFCSSTAVDAWHNEFLNFCSMAKSLVNNVTSLQCSVYIVNTIQVTVHPSPLPSSKDCPGECVCLASHTEDKETTLDSAAPSSAWGPSFQAKSCWCPCVVKYFHQRKSSRLLWPMPHLTLTIHTLKLQLPGLHNMIALRNKNFKRIS